MIPKHMKQKSPYDQMLVTLSALEGNISNIEEGIKPNIENLKQILKDLRHLSSWLSLDWSE